jgi:hypothetical protein
VFRAFLLAAVTLAVAAPANADDWTTYYERSGFRRTPDYAATVDYCRRLAAASPMVHYTSFGTSPQGRELPLLIVDRNGDFDAASVREGDNVVLLVQAGIHAGEIDGKDAGLMLIRDMVITGTHDDLLGGVTLLFIPIFNVDGHERSGRFNRPNQNGPEEMGWRVTAQNLNLNRDYLKADAPEMRDWLRLYREWLPEFFVDCHVTDGADYQYVVTYAVEQYGTLDRAMTEWLRERFATPLEQRMGADGTPVALYQWYRRYHDPRSGVRSWVASPRLSEGYCAEQNRPALLIETHSLKDYHSRVDGTFAALVHTIEILQRERGRLRKLVADADRRVASAAYRARPFPVSYTYSDTDSVMIELAGIDYVMETSGVTGGKYPRFTGRKVTLSVPYFNRQVVTAEVMLPEGYIIPPQWRDVIERLETHGVRVARTDADVTLAVDSYRFSNVVWEDTPTEGRHRLSYEIEPVRQTRTFPAGSAVIDMSQRAARIVAHALEPRSPESFVSWGFFDPIFERKEYIESYVIEPLAAEMLADDPQLAREFATWHEQNPEADPRTIRDWFYRRTPYWDSHYNRYPVGRISSRAQLEKLLR